MLNQIELCCINPLFQSLEASGDGDEYVVTILVDDALDLFESVFV